MRAFRWVLCGFMRRWFGRCEGGEYKKEGKQEQEGRSEEGWREEGARRSADSG